MKISKIIKCVLRTITRNRVSGCGPVCVLKTQSEKEGQDETEVLELGKE